MQSTKEIQHEDSVQPLESTLDRTLDERQEKP
jgi:hypothetical protein